MTGRSPFPPIPTALANFAAWRRQAALAEALRAADAEPPAAAIRALHAAATRAEQDIAALAQRLTPAGRIPRQDTQRRRARKHFLCAACGGPIPRGTYYLDHNKHREHLECPPEAQSAAQAPSAQLPESPSGVVPARWPRDQSPFGGFDLP